MPATTTWLLLTTLVWLSLWASKIFAHFLPSVFQFFAGVVSSGTRKYALILRALTLPVSIALWALVSFVSFAPIMTRNPDQEDSSMKHWETIVLQILAAALVASLLYLAQKLLIQLISISYHRKQFNTKIIDSKRNVQLISQLFEASRSLFPMYCQEFQEEDYIITDSLNLAVGKNAGHARSGSATPIRMLQKVGRYGDKVVGGKVSQGPRTDRLLNPPSLWSCSARAYGQGDPEP